MTVGTGGGGVPSPPAPGGTGRADAAGAAASRAAATPASAGPHRARRGAAAGRRLPGCRRQSAREEIGSDPGRRIRRRLSSQRALSLFREVHHSSSEEARALNELGLVQQLSGDYPAAAASHQQALALCHDCDRGGQAETLNCLGELASRTADGRHARDHHARALAIAREIGILPEEARALEGIGRSHLDDGHASEGTAYLGQALTIYQRIEAPAARRVQESLLQLGQDNMASAAEQ
jgi:tetratricopeptide (TPR) repeat protein